MEARRRREPERYEEPRERRIEPIEVEEQRPYTAPYAYGGPGRDLVHWGPVWAGVMAGFVTMIFLGLLGLAVGLAAFNVPTPTGEVGTVAAIWSGVTLLVSYFIGGWIAGRTTSYRDTVPAAFFAGSMVFALSIVLLLLMAGIGAAGIFGAALNIFGPITGNIAPNLSQDQALSALQTSALWSLVTLILAYGAAVLGAYVGVKAMVIEDR